MDMPDIKEGQWVTIGSSLSAVVSQVYTDQTNEVAEVVYLNGVKAINNDIKWTGENWEFTTKGASGGYADKYLRLVSYVAQLRAGRKPEGF